MRRAAVIAFSAKISIGQRGMCAAANSKPASGKVVLTTCKRAAARVIGIQNPSRRNALSRPMMEDLAAAVGQLEAEARSAEAQWAAGRTGTQFEDADGAAYRIVVVQGDGGHFCSGADLSMLGDLHGAPGGADGEDLRSFGRWMNATMTTTLTALRRLPQVSVAVVQGAALGGGAELTTATDLRLVASDARIRFVQATMAVSPGWGGGTRLADIVGPQAARRLLISCAPVTPQRAMELGLADATFDAADATDAAARTPNAPIAAETAAAEEGCPGCADGCCRLAPAATAALPLLVAPAAPVSSLAACKAALPVVEPLTQEAESFLRVWGAQAQQDVLARLRR